jgi:Auxiliary Activity family 9 (formerly GH61)
MSFISRLLGCAGFLSFLATKFPSVAAHGYVSRLVIDGRNYTGPSPYQNPFSSAIRQISDVSPVKNLTSSDLACGFSAKLASLVANATSGSKIEIHVSIFFS